ncbi:MAG TPA: HD-GYP domain-containing protein [Gemmatimonadales bacterium]|nr:HD-GYP domain-containing protein [Gemmatimonadales bacterium]
MSSIAAHLRIRLYAYVAAVALGGVAALAAAWHGALAFPGWWPLGCFFLVATILEGTLTTRLRMSGTGSMVFVAHLAAIVVVGPFWAASVAASSNVIGSIVRGNGWPKVVFNSAQIILAVLGGAYIYRAFGGGFPPAYFASGAELSMPEVQRDLGLFFLMALMYFAVNATAVSGVLALSSGRAFREVWNLNARGVLAYDVCASLLALLMASAYEVFEHWFGFGSIGVIALVLPILAVRHVYGLYRQLQESGQELLEVMVKAIEARDPYTSGHSRRVSQMSRTIATELGLPAREIEQVETAALLHDVGKIHEEFAPLLRKEGRLTPEETTLMQTHAARSADLVGIISKFRGPIQLAVRHHHERWDGRGYPDGITAERIPLGARIILVSDTIDAMTTDRPYRKRLPLDTVVAELLKHQGTQFDPRIVALAISSVAVRRLIAEPGSRSAPAEHRSAGVGRLSRAAAGMWRVDRAQS